MRIRRTNNKNFRLLTSLIFTFVIPVSIFAQSDTLKNEVKVEKARQQLQIALNDTALHNVVGPENLILKDSEQAIKFAENILFDIYGKKEIIKQKPYDIHKIDNYWILSGTLPQGWKGGTFLIIINAIDCRVLRITHGK